MCVGGEFSARVHLKYSELKEMDSGFRAVRRAGKKEKAHAPHCWFTVFSPQDDKLFSIVTAQQDQRKKPDENDTKHDTQGGDGNCGCCVGAYVRFQQ